MRNAGGKAVIDVRSWRPLRMIWANAVRRLLAPKTACYRLRVAAHRTSRQAQVSPPRRSRLSAQPGHSGLPISAAPAFVGMKSRSPVPNNEFTGSAVKALHLPTRSSTKQLAENHVKHLVRHRDAQQLQDDQDASLRIAVPKRCSTMPGTSTSTASTAPARGCLRNCSRSRNLRAVVM